MAALNDWYKVVEVSMQDTYNQLVLTDNIDVNTVYYIIETKRVYLGKNQFGIDVFFSETTLPTENTDKIKDKLYIVKTGESKGLYYWDGIVYQTLISQSTVTTDGEQTLTNKTIDADENVISNLDITHFKTTAIDGDLAAGGSDTKLPTSKAIFDYVSTITASVFDLKGSIDLDEELSKLANAKKGSSWIVTSSTHYLNIDFNTNDVLVFIRDGGPTPIEGDIIKLDNTESPDIIRKILASDENEIVTFTETGDIKSSSTKITTVEPTNTSNNSTIPTSKAVFDAVDRKANRAENPVADNIGTIDEYGNLINSGIAKAEVLTAESVHTIKNKTININDGNIINNLTLASFAANVVANEINSEGTDGQLISAKTLYEALKITRI